MDLQTVMKAAIAHPDCPCDVTVIEGHRPQADQDARYAQGRTAPGPIVTWTRNSRHTKTPSQAVDMAPCDSRGNVLWSEIEMFDAFGAHVERVAADMGIGIEWGGRWKTKDRPHFQTKAR